MWFRPKSEVWPLPPLPHIPRKPSEHLSYFCPWTLLSATIGHLNSWQTWPLKVKKIVPPNRWQPIPTDDIQRRRENVCCPQIWGIDLSLEVARLAWGGGASRHIISHHTLLCTIHLSSVSVCESFVVCWTIWGRGSHMISHQTLLCTIHISSVSVLLCSELSEQRGNMQKWIILRSQR